MASVGIVEKTWKNGVTVFCYLLNMNYLLFSKKKSTLQVNKLLLKDISLPPCAGLGVVCIAVFFSIVCSELLWRPKCNFKNHHHHNKKPIIPGFLDGYYQVIYFLTFLLAFQDALFDLQSHKTAVLNSAASFVSVSHGITKRKCFDTFFCYPIL